MYRKCIEQERSVSSTLLWVHSNFFRLHALSKMCVLCTYIGMCKMLILLKLQNFGIKKHIFWDLPETNKKTKPDTRALLHFLSYICINCSDTQK